MRMKWLAAMAVCLGLLVAGTGRADDDTEARALLDKAIQAMGKDAEAKADKYKAAVAKIKGTVLLMAQVIPYTGEFAAQMPEQSRLTLEVGDPGGQTFKLV